MNARTAVPRYREYDGPALLRQGFRPFFLGAGLWALLAVPLWLLVFEGRVDLPSGFSFAAWHSHEMIFGFAGAVVAGFLLTAIPNWTGRLPLSGLPLAGLCAAWLLGRLAIAGSAVIGPLPAAIVDLGFPLLLLAVALREIVAGRNWRNLPIMAGLGLLILANLLTHLPALAVAETGPYGERLGIATLTLMICLIGGRIVPSFTRNWLAKREAQKLSAPFGKFDKACLLVTLAALLAWVAAPEVAAVGLALLAAGVLNVFRLARWQGGQTLSEPLVWSLHLGFLWVPLGLVLLGLGLLLPESLPPSAGLHALTTGAIGSMTLAVMTRATLGHSGRALTADGWTTVIYLGVSAAALTRVLASLLPGAYLPLLWLSGALWILAFGAFVLRYGPMHLTRRAPGPEKG